jgi:hypothetical protein
VTKATVTKLFFAGVFAAITGGILMLATLVVGSANDMFVWNGSNIVGVDGSALTWPVVGLGIFGALGIAGGAFASLVSWVGALVNVAQLESKAWFVVLLLAGLFFCVVPGMIAYIIAGPSDNTRATPRAMQTPAATS